MRPCLWLTVLLAILALGAARADTIEVSAFGEEGWMADDTRSSTATDLVGLQYTHYPKPTQPPTAADDAVIAEQIRFLYQGPMAVSCLAMMKESVSGGYSKCTLSKVDEAGFATGSAWVSGFSADYRYYTNSTGEAPALKLGVRSPLWTESQTGFTASRSGEPAWDLILVDWRGTNPPWTVGAWDTFETDENTACWKLYRQAGNGFFNAPPGDVQTLAQWAADTRIAHTVGGTEYTWGDVLFGTGAKVVSLQFGAGSSAQASNTYIDWIETSLLNGGERVDFSGPLPPVHNVTRNTYHFTIQSAVDAALAGDLIEIAAGTYEEQVHIVTESLTLDGAGAGATILRSPVDLTALFGTNYPIVFVDGVAAATLTDLTVDGAGRGNGNYRFVGIGFSNAGGTVARAEVIGIRDTPFSGAQHGVGIYSVNNSGLGRTLTLNDVEITDFQKNAVALHGPDLTVDLDEVTAIGAGATTVTAQNGIQIGTGASGTVDDCEIRDVAFAGTSWTATGFLPSGAGTVAADGLVIEGCQTSVYWIDTDGTLSHTTVSDPLGDAVYVYAAGAADGGGPRLKAQPLEEDPSAPDGRGTVDFTMSYCTLLGQGVPYSWGFGPFSDGQVNCTVEHCWFYNWDYAVYCYDNGGGVTAVIHGNSFTDCGTLAIENEFAAVQDASGNWYGTADPAAVAALVGAAIDYTPWLGQDGAYPAQGFTGDFTTLWVDDDSPQSGSSGRIQEGIGLVSGSTVQIAAGTYREQLRIDQKSLTLAGAGASATIIEAVDPAARSPYAVTNWSGTTATIDPCIGITGPAVVQIADLTVDGRTLGPNQFYGIHLFNANGTVADCRIDGITYAGGPGAGNVVSVAATHGDGGACALAVNDTEIPVFQKGGILVMGPQATCALTGNTVMDAPSPAVAGNGIQISYGATGTLTDNHVSGVGYTGPNWSATGVLLFESGNVVVVGGLVEGCQSGVNFSQWNWIHPQTTTPVVTISGTEFDACEWSASVHLADTGSALDFTVTGCNIHDGTASGVDLWGSGQDPWGGSTFGPWTGGTLTALIENCTVDALDGVVEYVDPTASGNALDIVARYNDLSGNDDYGAWSNYGTTYLDARSNWWGDAAGPNLVTLLDGGAGPAVLPSPSTPGTELPEQGTPLARQSSMGAGDYGVNVSPFVDFDPWIGDEGGENIVCVPAPLDLSATAPSGGIDVRYLGGGTDGIYGYSIEVAWDRTVVTIDAQSDITLPATGPFASAALFQVVDLSSGDDGLARIDAALGGAQPGTTGPADLFHANVAAAGCGVSVFDLTIRHIRNTLNQPVLGVYAADGEVRVDTELPAIDDETLVRTNLPNTGYAKDGDDLQITADITDGCLTGGALMITADLSGLLEGGATAAAPTNWVAPTATWTLSGVDLAGGDGLKTATLKAVDVLGNQITATVSVYADNTIPSATVSGFTAMPQHNEVALTWTNPGGDPNLDAYGIRLRRAAWGDYPLYMMPPPTYPGSGEGTLVREAAPLYSSWVDVFDGTGAERDIYYYQAFVIDAAYNVSAPAAGARDRSTNYWLGDVAPFNSHIGNGLVTGLDISALGATYGKSSGMSGWSAHCDVGPTDDGTRLGVPVPDDLVSFEDLMVFAMNYGNVAPDGGAGIFGLPIAAVADDVSLELAIASAATAEGQIVLRVMLTDAAAAAQGAGFAIGFDPSVVAFVDAAAGTGPAGIEEIFFHANGVPEISVAALGQGATLGGTGELAVVRFRRVGAGPLGFTLLDARVRDARNRELLGSYAEVTVAPPVAPGRPVTAALPAEVFLAAARPNPVVGMTAIAFGLPSAAPVNLVVYDVSGRQIRTLVAGTLDAGEHRVEWNRLADDGSRVANGLYFCRLQAGGATLTRRMVVSE